MSPAPLAMLAPLRSAQHTLPAPLHCVPLNIRSLPRSTAFRSTYAPYPAYGGSRRFCCVALQPQAAEPRSKNLFRTTEGGEEFRGVMSRLTLFTPIGLIWYSVLISVYPTWRQAPICLSSITNMSMYHYGLA